MIILFFIISNMALLGIHDSSAQYVMWQDSSKNLSMVKIESMKEKVFKNLQLCYECEFSPTTHTTMNDEAEYDQDELASHWSKKYDILLFYKNTTPIGFTVVNYGSMVQEKLDVHDIGEFYITPLYRKRGYGKIFAQEIFKIYGGSWEVRQLLELEKTARVFWHKVIASLAHGGFQEFVDHPQWQGYIQFFTVKKSSH